MFKWFKMHLSCAAIIGMACGEEITNCEDRVIAGQIMTNQPCGPFGDVIKDPVTVRIKPGRDMSVAITCGWDDERLIVIGEFSSPRVQNMFGMNHGNWRPYGRCYRVR